MTDLMLVAIMVAFFALAVGLIQVLGRMIDSETDLDLDTDEDTRPGPSESPTRLGRPA
jgi:hypothetical protein